jgi:replicative DNA helicase
MSDKFVSFDEEFQTKIAALILRDSVFNRRVDGLIEPSYFENGGHAIIVNCVLRYFQKYDTVPAVAVLQQLIKEDKAAKIIREEMIPEIKESIVALLKEDITDGKYVADKVAEFARHKAMEDAGIKYAELVEKGDLDKAANVIEKASNVGTTEGQKTYDLFGDDELEDRERVRNEKVAGISKRKAISTGIRALDNALFHGGWYRGEFYVFMGPPKSGKSFCLAWFSQIGALLGFNVLFITLEVSREITCERMDAAITGIPIKELKTRTIEAKEKIKLAVSSRGKVGKLVVEEYPTGTFRPKDLKRSLEKHRANGIVFDMVVVDYCDIMASNLKQTDNIERSKSIYVDMRAISQIEDVALISAMQTNRDGAKATTAKAEHAAEDFNKIRIPDLVISINATETEKANKEARLHFAASRNQEGGFSVHINQDLERACFIKSVIKVE